MTTERSLAAASSSTVWDIVIKSRVLAVWGVVCAGGVLSMHIIAAVLLTYNVESLGVSIETLDQLGLVVLGIVCALVFLTLTRPRLRAGAHGVEIRSFFTTRFIDWQTIWGLGFPHGAHCARLELAQYEYLPIWALNRWDKKNLTHNIGRYVSVQDQYIIKE